MTSSTNRQIFDIPMEVVAGHRFQPTGFPDLGAATFERPRRDRDGNTVRGDDGEVVWDKALLVESAQSMANRAEAVGWDATADQPVDVLSGLSWIRVVDGDGAYLASSRTEAHRLASAFVKDATLGGDDMVEVIKERLGLRDDHPVSPSAVAGAIFALDPLCLVHGVFLADNRWPGQPKVARALTGFVEAADVKPADSGGVKKDHVRHSLHETEGGTSEGYGTVPYHRREWTAAEITASFTIDRAQIRSYALGAAATGLLEAIAQWEIRCLIDGPLRLRTACDLTPTTADVRDRDGEPLPARDDLEGEIRRGIAACADLVGPGKAIDVIWGGGRARKSKR